MPRNRFGNDSELMMINDNIKIIIIGRYIFYFLEESSSDGYLCEKLEFRAREEMRRFLKLSKTIEF